MPARSRPLRPWPILPGLATLIVVPLSCHPPPTPPPEPEPDIVAEGRRIFFTETFEGNGRTCGSCHREEENFGLAPAFIATLPDGDPLFVAENQPALARNFENPRLMRALALILENQDGFADLPNDFNMRGIPHLLGLRNSVASSGGPRTGWGGDEC